MSFNPADFQLDLRCGLVGRLHEERADGHHADGAEEKNKDLELALKKDVQEISEGGPVVKRAVHGLPFQYVDDDTFREALAEPVLAIMSKGRDLLLKNGHTPSSGSLSTVCITIFNTVRTCKECQGATAAKMGVSIPVGF